MKKQKKLVVGNWKMNPVSIEEAKDIARGVKRAMGSIKRTQVVLCPPLVYLPLFSKIPSGLLFLGAQDAYFETVGPFTGEVSFSQLSQFKVSFVIVGHSERRKMGDTDEMINKKVKAIVNEGMTAVICVGESIRDHHGEYLHFVKNQVLSALKDVSKKLMPHVVIAYEPTWAIGGASAMNPRDLHEMSIFIRKILKDFAGSLSDDVRIIYGASVDKVNAESLVRDGNVVGLLPGRQSLKPKEFVEIIKIVDAI